MKLHRLQVKTQSETFEADRFEWGERNEKGEQSLSFFMKGALIRYLPIDELVEIKNMSFLDARRERVRRILV